MVAAVVGEAFLSAFIEVVLDRLASPELVNLIRGKKLDDNLVQRLKNTLYAVEAVLNDAEQRQIKDSAVNKWLDDLKDAVYFADDLLDHISTKAATRKNKEVQTWKLLTPLLIMLGIAIILALVCTINVERFLEKQLASKVQPSTKRTSIINSFMMVDIYKLQDPLQKILLSMAKQSYLLNRLLDL